MGNDKLKFKKRPTVMVKGQAVFGLNEPWYSQEVIAAAGRQLGINQVNKPEEMKRVKALLAGADSPLAKSLATAQGSKAYDSYNDYFRVLGAVPGSRIRSASASGGGGGAGGAGGAAAPGASVAGFQQSVQQSNKGLINSINKQLEEQKAQAELYMGKINELMESMKGTNLSSIVPYASVTTVAPATGAQTTQPITARPLNPYTDLSITPLNAVAGAGLNLAF